RPAGTLSFSGYEQIIPAAVAGHGVGLGRSPLVKDLLASGELVAPFKSSADPARAYYAVVSKSAEGRPEVAEFVAWLKQEAGKKSLLRPFSKGEDDLADVLRALQQAMRLGRLDEREGLVDLGPDLARVDERPDFLAQVARDVALELDRPRTQRGAADREA